MGNLRSTYRYEDDESTNNVNGETLTQSQPTVIATPKSTTTTTATGTPILTDSGNLSSEQQTKQEPEISDVISEIEPSEGENDELQTHKHQQQHSSEKHTTTISDEDDDQEEDEVSPRKKRKSITSVTSSQSSPKINLLEEEEEEIEESEKFVEKIPPIATIVKKRKKKSNNVNSVWVKSTSRKGKKKNKLNNNSNQKNTNNHHNVASAAEDYVLITPVNRFPDKTDDSPDMKICLSKVYKAEKIELSDDRLSAGSSKGYRMVRATRGVVQGAWYFEIRVLELGETGHTRLGWSTDKGDLQAPVGYDRFSFGYRDVDGSKVHKALREKYGEEGYVQGDVIGCYINLPDGNLYAPKPVEYFWYKGQKYSSTLEAKEESPKVVPGSEICFFRNGIFQGVAFKDLCGGRYFPAASMYTLPNQPNCVVKFNFGPDFDFFPQDFGDRLIPSPITEVPYQGFDGRVENGESAEKK